MTDMNKKNSGLLQSAKLRIILFVAGLLALGVVVAAVWHHHRLTVAYEGAADVSSVPSQITNVPGAGDPSDNYVKAQNIENAEQSRQAKQDATSSIPTITRASFLGQDSDFDQDGTSTTDSAAGSQKSCPLAAVIHMDRPNPANCGVENLKLARQAGVTAEELRCQACSCSALHAAGYTAGELKNVGFGAGELKTCGFNLQQLVNAGYSAKDLSVAGFTPDQLRNVGFSTNEIQQAMLGAHAEFCSVASLQKARQSGESAASLKDQGCDVAALKAAGFSAGELKAAGFSAEELKAAGFSAGDLKAAGFTAQQLHDAGFSASDLKVAGFGAKDLANAGFDAAQLKEAGFSAAALKAAGFTANQLSDAGFGVRQLQAAGFSTDEIQKALASSTGACSVKNLQVARQNGISPVELKNQGCSLAALKAAGFTVGELKAAGFSAKDLKDAGFTAQQLHDGGFSAAALKAAGYTSADLKNAGYSADQLKQAGFSAKDLKAAGFSAADLKNAGFSAAELRSVGFSANALKNAGFDVQALKNAGFSAGALKAAGFSAGELKSVGFSAAALRDAGFGAAELKSAGFSAHQLTHAGFTSGDLLRAGFSEKQAGYLSPNSASTPNANLPGQTDQPQDNANNVSENAQAAGGSIPSIDGSVQAQQIRALQEAQQQMMSQQQRQDAVQQMQGQMMMQATKMMAGWSNPPAQTMQQAIPKVKSVASGNSNSSNAPTGPIIKAGTIMFGVLDTSVNSDEQTPILATIVSGELKGAKLIGQFARVDKRILLNFTLINVESFPHSFAANIVAIDPNTAHTALAGYVDNHYLLRYGSLFASAFISGVSQGVAQAGTTQNCFGPFCTTTHNNYDTKQYVALGLGQVGQQYANTFSGNFYTPPTVKIPGGVGIGLLFMADVTLPQPLPQSNDINALGGE